VNLESKILAAVGDDLHHAGNVVSIDVVSSAANADYIGQPAKRVNDAVEVLEVFLRKSDLSDGVDCFGSRHLKIPFGNGKKGWLVSPVAVRPSNQR
jgi:hypothetical protein